MDEVHKSEKYIKDKTELNGLARKIMGTFLKNAREEAIEAFSDSHLGLFTSQEMAEAINALNYVIFEVPDMQLGQDADAMESVLERLRREYLDKFRASLEEVARKVGMLWNISFYIPDESGENENGMPEIGCVAVYGVAGNQEVAVHFEVGSPKRIGKEARFVYEDERETELYSISDAFKELVKILEEQGKMIPKI